eukprot:CAMPEP_0174237780 /NCGR_PEP_ID=MMETSP0417-20130205/9345_1 /TAXON_ID=242541 /ORGANISM="Mayorella sp, Strain BSH-02190019" /LENGTH=283 /DNA_ID=CAMNT_0015316565 /DNA_START=107 /DNA_END=958 /DNA_ORIENTATION=+
MAFISYPFRFGFFTLWGIVFLIPAIALFVAVTLPQIDDTNQVYKQSSFHALFIEVTNDKNKTKYELFHPGGDDDNIIAYFPVKSTEDTNYLLEQLLLSANITIDDLPSTLPPIPPENAENQHFIKLLQNIEEILTAPKPLSDSQRADLLQDLLNLNFELDGHDWNQPTTANGTIFGTLQEEYKQNETHPCWYTKGTIRYFETSVTHNQTLEDWCYRIYWEPNTTATCIETTEPVQEHVYWSGYYILVEGFFMVFSLFGFICAVFAAVIEVHPGNYLKCCGKTI